METLWESSAVYNYIGSQAIITAFEGMMVLEVSTIPNQGLWARIKDACRYVFFKERIQLSFVIGDDELKDVLDERKNS